MTPVIRAVDVAGVRHELNAVPGDETTARRLATRAAGLLGAIGDPATWRAGKLVVLDVSDGRLLMSARVRVPSQRFRDAEAYTRRRVTRTCTSGPLQPTSRQKRHTAGSRCTRC